MKKQRWYEIVENVLYIYDQPYREKAMSVSCVTPADLPYYRNNFKLQKVWNKESMQ